MACGIKGLRVFPQVDENLPQGDGAAKALQSPSIKKVVCCSLGPEGTNIAQASRRWLARMGVVAKSEVILCDTPEACLKIARSITQDEVLPVFWTCAVYARESEFFFGNPDVYAFFFQEPMLLDSMQLATRHELANVVNGEVPKNWKISSHPSPQHLVKSLACEIILVNSNAAAAEHCKDGFSEACITTEEARRIYGLETLHIFGSPLMIFFGGITEHGADVIRKAVKELGWSKEFVLEEKPDPAMGVRSRYTE